MTDSGWPRFGCSSCGRNFPTQGALTKHVNSPKHAYKCALCKTHYADIDAFRLHLDLAHLGYRCTFASCPFWSARESDVDKHSQQHAQDQKHADLKAQKFGNRAGPEESLKTGRRTRFPRDLGEHSSPDLPGSDQSRKKDAIPSSSSFSSTTGDTFGPRRMACPFWQAIPEPCQNDSQDTYATCRTLHMDISSFVRHLSQPIHGLKVTDNAISSFDVESKVPPVQKAGICKRCWKVFRTATDLSTHMTYPCKKPKLTTLDKRDILYDAFVRAKDRVQNTTEEVSVSNTTQTSPNLTEQLPSMYSSSSLPKLEEKVLSDFTCCDRTWPTLHDLLQHSEEDHTALAKADRVNVVSGKPHPAWKGVADRTEVSTDGVESTLTAAPADLEKSWLSRGSRKGTEHKQLLPLPGVSEQALDALDHFVPFPPYKGGQPGIDSDELFDPDSKFFSARPTQMAVSPSNEIFAQRLRAANSQYLSAADSPASASSRGDESLFRHDSPGRSYDLTSAPRPPDPMSMPTTAPNFGPSYAPLTKSPSIGMPEDFMSYSFNTNNIPLTNASFDSDFFDVAESKEVFPRSDMTLPPIRSSEYSAMAANNMPPIHALGLVNAEGDKKVRKNGQLLGGRKYRMRTFALPNHGDTLFMLVQECMALLGYEDMQSFCAFVPSCFRIDPWEVDPLLSQGLLEGVSLHTQVWVVQARCIFQQFGRFVIVNGQVDKDDYSLPYSLRFTLPPISSLEHYGPYRSLPSAEAPSDTIQSKFGPAGEQIIATATAEAARGGNPVGAKDSQPSGRENRQDIKGEVQKPDSVGPLLSDYEVNTWNVKEPDDVDADHAKSQPWHGAGSSFGHPESSFLPRPEAPVVTAQTDSGYARVFLEKEEDSVYGEVEPGNHSGQEAPAVTAQTDSGYASHTHGKEVGREPLEAKEPSPLADTDVMTEDHDSDVGTIYSDDRSQASVSRTQCYISEFVDHLLGKIRHQMDDFSVGRIMDCLPELLQAFALKVGQSSATRGHFEVMYFVHKHRRAIALSLQERVKQDEAHGLAEVEARETDLAGMSLDDKLSLWAQKASDAEPEHEFEAEELPEIEPLEDELDTNELFRYQSLIMKSTAFDWLVSSLQREIQLANSAVVGMMDIRTRIVQGLPSPRHVSRKQAVPCVQVTFTAPWDPASFIEEQGYDVHTEDILGRVITLTGSSADVQAVSCEQYLCQTWPSTGKHMLRIIGDTFRMKDVATRSAIERRTYILPDNTRITATCMAKTLTLEASGTAYSMVEIGEQLGWLITALRSSPDESRIAVFYPTIERFQCGADPSQPFSCDISTSFVGYEGTLVSPDSRNGECWRKLFRNPVIVWGYPIPRRPELVTGTGLEIPLDMLVALTDASGLSEFDGKTFIKGYSAMLIPTKQVDDLVLWHLLFNDDGERISYTDCRLAALDHIQTTGIKQARHILGWVSHARNNTGSPHANYHIKWSGLGKPRERHAWEKVVISGGDPVGVSASFVIGKKDKGIFAGALGGYTSRLKFIAKQYVVLYDLADRRAWLVDGLSALLHLVRASLEHDQRDVFNSFFLYKRGQIKECSATMHGLDAAAAVLFNRENHSLKLYTESEDTWDEETERQQDGARGAETVKEVVSKRKVTYYCLRDKVLEIFALLEKMVDHLNNVQSEAGVGFRLRCTPRNILEGFDFMDVATSGAPLRPHMIKLNICESGRGWTDLLRSIQAITLFGKGFGELIAPSTSSLADPPCGGCGYGIALPTGKDYLATCVSVVERILTTRGNTESIPWCLADDIYWHTPGALFDPCQCAPATKGAKPSDRVQVLLPSTFPKLWGRDFASPNNLESQGAVIFSHNWRVPFRLGHQSTQDQKMLEPPDSGLGTSIGSSSGRSQLSGSFDDSETQASNVADGSSVHSSGSPTEAQSVPNAVVLALTPDHGTSNRKRKLVEMVDRVKRKVLKTSANIELD